MFSKTLNFIFLTAFLLALFATASPILPEKPDQAALDKRSADGMTTQSLNETVSALGRVKPPYVCYHGEAAVAPHRDAVRAMDSLFRPGDCRHDPAHSEFGCTSCANHGSAVIDVCGGTQVKVISLKEKLYPIAREIIGVCTDFKNVGGGYLPKEGNMVYVNRRY